MPYPCRIADSPFPWIGYPWGPDHMGTNELTLWKYRGVALVWGCMSRNYPPANTKDYSRYALVSVFTDWAVVKAEGCTCCTDPEDTWFVLRWGSLKFIHQWDYPQENVSVHEWLDLTVDHVRELLEETVYG